ncbi:Mpo1-like protein [Hyphomicrobium sp. DY-1]|uniref:Mpo1-like protein n=1 Tax=Hyphomicrobium sp. DY-1 TaxID=3075650 RepID=UPI0039C172A8
MATSSLSKRNSTPEPAPKFASFDEFWPYYLKAHSKPETRAMHMIGTTLGLLGVAGWLKTGRGRYLAAGITGSYASAWAGHFAFERNNPAAFENPLWSLEADLKMYGLWLTRGLEAEIRRVAGSKEKSPRQ